MTASLQAKPNGTQGALLVNGAEVVVFDGTGITAGVNKSAVSQMPTLGTVVNTTSGTAHDITGIPSWAKKITVMLDGCSTNGTSPYQVQLGAGSIQSSGYGGGVSHGTTSTTNSSGFVVQSNVLAALASSGHVVLTNVNGNKWVASVAVGSPGSQSCVGGGSVTLSGALDRLRLTTVGGTDTFDAGSFNILVE